MKSRPLARRATRSRSLARGGKAQLWEISARCRQQRRLHRECEPSTQVALISISVIPRPGKRAVKGPWREQLATRAGHWTLW